LLFFALQGRRQLFLRLEIESPMGAEAWKGEVWWTANRRPFQVADSVAFALTSGGAHRETVSVEIPVEVDSLQIRPGQLRVYGGGKPEIALHSIELATPVASLRRWNRVQGFLGWHSLDDRAGFRAEDGALRLLLTTPDGILQLDDIQSLRDQRRRQLHARIAAWGGLAGGLLQSALLLLFIRRSPAPLPQIPPTSPTSAPPSKKKSKGKTPDVPPPGSRFRIRPAVVVIVVTAAIALPLAWKLYQRFAQRGAPPVFNDTGEYSLTFVDHHGRRLSEKEGSLRLTLDPYTFYRNAPGQRTRAFSTDAHGYRGGFNETDPRPRVLFLGGSAGFGFGLASDSELYTARLEAMEPRLQMINTSVVGFLSGQELAELVHRGPAVAPVAVVALDGWNDLNVPVLGATREPFANVEAGFNWDVFYMVESRLRLLTLGGAAEPPPAEALEDLSQLTRRINDTFLANMVEMRRVAAARGIPFLAVLQPCISTRKAMPEGERQVLATFASFVGRGDPVLYDNFLAEARKGLTREGIPFLDMNAAAPFATGGGPLFLDIIHPSAAGHQVMAEEIRAPLAALLAAKGGKS
ncbi:MAG TPA: hypothetical protein VN851_08430, partial [Thermoanaerobaculia bacterium]|nr:hypothetical protein [Thermoanaerobaculia bacterium]